MPSFRAFFKGIESGCLWVYTLKSTEQGFVRAGFQGLGFTDQALCFLVEFYAGSSVVISSKVFLKSSMSLLRIVGLTIFRVLCVDT